MSRLARCFFQGLLIVLPIVVTVWVVKLVWEGLAPLFGWLGDRLDRVTGDVVTIPASLLAPAGAAVAIVAITLTGALASNLVGRRIVGIIDQAFTRLPLVKLLFSSVKDLLGAFVGERRGFDRPVLVTLREPADAKVLGFLTRDGLEFLGVRDHVAVYLPQSYNFAGNLLIVPRERVQPLTNASAEVMAFLVSGGVSSPGAS